MPSDASDEDDAPPAAVTGSLSVSDVPSLVMGAGASLPPDVPQWLDEAKCREVCGDRFDEDAFKRLAGKQGKIQKQQLVAAARRQPAGVLAVPSTRGRRVQPKTKLGAAPKSRGPLAAVPTRRRLALKGGKD